MVPAASSPPPFHSSSVARARKRRDALRLLAIAVIVGVAVALTSGRGAASIPRFVLLVGLPLALMLLALRRVLPLVRGPRVGWVILFRSLAYTVVLVTAILLAFVSVGPVRDLGAALERNRVTLLAALFLGYGQVLLLTAVRGVARKVGPEAFWPWIRGYYYSPKEEERVFMFIDLRGSTALAETLGDRKFSRLVRDCFEDLTGPVVETRAEVSHYIGDEAVLTWRPQRGLPEARCLQCFFRLQAALRERREHYLREYGRMPEFKAGAHLGRVVATEVGTIKSEIVFHGDVLNTTARVQESCAAFGTDLLITEALASRLPPVPWLELRSMGEVPLKGKREPVRLFSVRVKGG